MMSWDVWGLAIRPRTLPAAAAGVLMGSALAWHDGFFQPLVMLVCLLVALLLQIGSNLVNDVLDFERGTDASTRLGPIRVTQAGLLTPMKVKLGATFAFGLAILLGLYLAQLGGWPIILIGAAAIISAITYTGGPFPLGYHGLGDIFVFIFFGVVSVAGTYYLQAGFVSRAAWCMTIPTGLNVTAILVVNNLRDLENDRVAGKRTLAVILGEHATKFQYLICVVISYFMLPFAIWIGILPWESLAAWISLPIAFRATRVVWAQKGRPLNMALAGTSQMALAFSLLFWAGLLLRS